jgi:hypothetical protein
MPTMWELFRERWKEGCGSNLCSEAQHVCLARGRVPSNILFVGEAPSIAADVVGQPFTGEIGAIMDDVIKRAGAEDYTHAFTNLVCCVPRNPEDRAEVISPPPEEAILTCRGRLRFTDAITMVSGFGLVRSREWFADTFLSDVRQPGSSAGGLFIPEEGAKSPWDRKNPVWKLKHDTKWIAPGSGRAVTYGKWTEYIKVNYCTYKVGDSQNKRWDHDNVIDRHPEIANGWTKEGLRQMLDFFCGTAVILGGLLRVLPPPAASIPVKGTVSATEHLLRLAEGHIQAGRLPILKDSTKEGLLEKARQREMSQYGRLLRPEPAGGQRSLFE